MRVGTLALECHAAITDGGIVVPRDELRIVDAQLQGLANLVARFGTDAFGAELKIGPNCLFGEGYVEFAVLWANSLGDASFQVEQFLGWCSKLPSGHDTLVVGGQGEERLLTIEGHEILSRDQTKRLISALIPSATGFVDEFVEHVSEAVRVTTSLRGYVVIGAGTDDYAPGTIAPSPCGKPLGQMPLLQLEN